MSLVLGRRAPVAVLYPVPLATRKRRLRRPNRHTLGSDLEAFAADLVASGAYADANEAVRDALRLLERSLDEYDQRVVDERSAGPFSPRSHDEIVAAGRARIAARASGQR